MSIQAGWLTVYTMLEGALLTTKVTTEWFQICGLGFVEGRGKLVVAKESMVNCGTVNQWTMCVKYELKLYESSIRSYCSMSCTDNRTVKFSKCWSKNREIPKIITKILAMQ